MRARVGEHATLPRDANNNVEKIAGAGDDGAAQMRVGDVYELLALACADLDALLVETWGSSSNYMRVRKALWMSSRVAHRCQSCFRLQL